ncbi:MAG: CHASE domain-containing protein, partial [Lachnospiraceae bacterium]
MKKQKTNKRILIRTVIVFAVCLLTISGIVGAIMRSGVEREKNRAQYTAEAATRRVGTQIKKYLVVSEILENVVKAGYEVSSEDFETISELMMDNEGVIEAIEYAPGGEVSDVYPKKGNEEAIGLNLLKNPAREKEANLARSSGQYTIAGPFELAQGGMGALLLDPIYLSDDGETENFWGFSVLVLNWDA